jgi:hypothetical protein
MSWRVVAGGAVAGGGLVAYKYQTEEGFRRAVRLYSELGPVVAAYRFEEQKEKVRPSVAKYWKGIELSEEEVAEKWRAMDSKWAKPTVKIVQELQGM